MCHVGPDSKGLFNTPSRTKHHFLNQCALAASSPPCPQAKIHISQSDMVHHCHCKAECVMTSGIRLDCCAWSKMYAMALEGRHASRAAFIYLYPTFPLHMLCFERSSSQPPLALDPPDSPPWSVLNQACCYQVAAERANPPHNELQGMAALP